MKKPAAASGPESRQQCAKKDEAVKKRKPSATQVLEPQLKLVKTTSEALSQKDKELPPQPSDVHVLRRELAKAQEELREAEGEQSRQKAILTQAEKDAKQAKAKLTDLDRLVAEKRAASADLSQQVATAVRAGGVSNSPPASTMLGPFMYKIDDVQYTEDDAGGELECEISVVIRAECYQVVQSGKSAKLIRFEGGNAIAQQGNEIPNDKKTRGKIGAKKKASKTDFVVSCSHVSEAGDQQGCVVGTTLGGGEVGRFAVPVGEDPFGMWLPGYILQSARIPCGSRLQLVNGHGQVFFSQSEAAAKPLLLSTKQLDGLKKQLGTEGCIISPTHKAVAKAVLKALNFGDESCLGDVMMGSYEFENIHADMPSKRFLGRNFSDDFEQLFALKTKLVKGLKLDDLASAFAMRQEQRGCETITAIYLGDKKKRKGRKYRGQSSRKLLISGSAPQANAQRGGSGSSASVPSSSNTLRTPTPEQPEEVLLLEVLFDFSAHACYDGMSDCDSDL